MKTVIDAKIIFESNKFSGVWSDEGGDVLTIKKVVDILRSGKYMLDEVIWNELMNGAEITLIIKHT